MKIFLIIIVKTLWLDLQINIEKQNKRKVIGINTYQFESNLIIFRPNLKRSAKKIIVPFACWFSSNFAQPTFSFSQMPHVSNWNTFETSSRQGHIFCRSRCDLQVSGLPSLLVLYTMHTLLLCKSGELMAMTQKSCIRITSNFICDLTLKSVRFHN